MQAGALCKHGKECRAGDWEASDVFAWEKEAARTALLEDSIVGSSVWKEEVLEAGGAVG